MLKKNTDYIILRKTPYHETSLVLAGISRNFGRVDLIIKGARKVVSKNLPTIDLFREINIDIDIKRESLHPIYSASLISNFDNIALKKEAYLDACEISRFILRNSQPKMPLNKTYKSVKSALRTLSERKNIYFSPWVKLVFLEENGLLPELPEKCERERQLLTELLQAAKGEVEIPKISEDYMKDIYSWVDSLCKFNDL